MIGKTVRRDSKWLMATSLNAICVSYKGSYRRYSSRLFFLDLKLRYVIYISPATFPIIGCYMTFNETFQ